ncbi:competence protein ComEC [Rhodospirillum rubrum]|uniref:ComEC/Rec2 family competence protein n=1 Tax=Rhodospirillum rubrum TaxID=1085 RepID=UPI001908E017|nr:ComEC/Rec2 family competence protein [Rhodospirillum rubrum]MBK1663278.1 competence protein ComEC [Rhodospirillum rubrum]MBK1675089.1 competence protein ComEC [Rhodospirillum rubrum]
MRKQSEDDGQKEAGGAASFDDEEGADPGLRIGPLARLLAAERAVWALWLPVALGLGIVFYFSLKTEPPAWMAPAVLALLALASPHLRAGDGLTAASRAAMALVIGFCVAQAWALGVAAPVIEREGRPGLIEGRVVANEPLDRGWRMILDDLTIEGLAAEKTPRRIRLRIHPGQTGGVAPLPGGRIAVLGRLAPPPTPVAPGVFDFARGLWFERIGGVGFALGPLRGGNNLADGPVPRIRAAVQGWRQGVTARIIAAEPTLHGPLTAALITGEQRAIDREIQEAMRASGLSHLLAISGLNMSLAAGLMFVLVRGGLALWPRAALLWPIKKLAAVAALVGCAAYLVLSGAQPPAERAFIMTGLVLLAVLIDRTALSMRTLALSAVVMLMIAPEILLGASFQMSFAAVIALIATYGALGPQGGRWRAGGGGMGRAGALYLGGVALSTVVATLATLPYGAYHFHRVALYGVIANMIAVPLTGFWVMPWCLVLLALMPFGLEGLAMAPLGWGLDGIVAVARWVGGWPGALLAMPDGPGWALGLVSLGGLWLCLWTRPWRLAGVVPILVGMTVPWLTPLPDVLINDEGTLIAVRAADGQLVFSDFRKARFTRKVWGEAFGGSAGEGRFPVAGASADGRLICDGEGCLYRRPGLVVALPRTLGAAFEDTALADLVIAPFARFAPPPANFPAKRVIDRGDLIGGGAHALWIGEDGQVILRTVASERGHRPWTGKPGPGDGAR